MVFSFTNLQKTNAKYLVFFITASIVTALSFHTMAAVKVKAGQTLAEAAGNALVRDDESLPDWCPPPPKDGMVAICGTVKSAMVDITPTDIQYPGVPIQDARIYIYEDNPLSDTGKLEGMLTNIFSSTTTNAEGKFGTYARKIGPPHQKVHLIVECDGEIKDTAIIETFHNTWNLDLMVACNPTYTPSENMGMDKTSLQPPPPFPLDLANGARESFLGCTNKPLENTAVGLSKREEPVINNIVGELNYEHRYFINNVYVSGGPGIPFFPDLSWMFRSPGGLWTPDCLLRNKWGNYQCDVPDNCAWGQDSDGNEQYKQLCTLDPLKGEPITLSGRPSPPPTDCSSDEPVARIYARPDCTANPNDVANYYAAHGGVDDINNVVWNEMYWENDPDGDGEDFLDPNSIYNSTHEDCLKTLENYATNQPILDGQGAVLWDIERADGVLCDDVGPVGMAPEDRLTRPFFLQIPKSTGEYASPFRRWDFRQNMDNFMQDPLASLQWTSKFFGSASASAGGAGAVYFRGFKQENPEPTTGLPKCEFFRMGNFPLNETAGRTVINSLTTSGPYGALARPFDTIEKLYYANARMLDDYVCTTNAGSPIRFCDIQPAFGTDTYCDVSKPGCRDTDLPKNLNKNLDPAVRSRILGNCGDFKLDRRYFPPDLVLATGDTQWGMKSFTPNDSVPTGTKSDATFEITETENDNRHTTGSRVALQQGGELGLASANSVACAVNPKWCAQQQINPDNRKEVNSLTDTFRYPFLEEPEKFKEKYLDSTVWEVNSVGGNQQSMCSIGNVYQFDITGPIEESNPEFMPDNTIDGNADHDTHKSAGASTWYFSETALSRDKILKTRENSGGELPEPRWDSRCSTDIADLGQYVEDCIPVRTSNLFLDLAYSYTLARDAWDSILILIGGDAQLHKMAVSLENISDATWNALVANNDWKIFGDRKDIPEFAIDELIPLPYDTYNVVMDYPLTESGFDSAFLLPKPNSGLDPEDWGPGHACYNFDTPIPEGYICGTYRENPKGISRTCRVDACLNFFRVEKCRCNCDDDDDPDEEYECDMTCDGNYIVVEVCDATQRLRCAQDQLTTEAWTNWKKPYNEPGRVTYTADVPGSIDIRGTMVNKKDIYPPENIDPRIKRHDHQDHYDPPHPPKMMCPGDDNKVETTRSDDDPRCWTTVAGPLRANPVLSETEIQTAIQTGTQIKNCNGYLTVSDDALRAVQEPPFEVARTVVSTAPGNPIIPNPNYNPDVDFKYDQQDLDESTIAGLKMFKAFAWPFAPVWGGNRICTVDAKMTNNDLEKPKQLDAAPETKKNLWIQGQEIDCGGSGDVATLTGLFSPEYVPPVSNEQKELHNIFYHCRMGSTYIPEADTREKIQILTTYNPEMDNDDGWDCPLGGPPSPELAMLTGASGGGSCQISAGTLKSCGATFDALPDEFSEMFRLTLNWSATKLNIPAAAIVAQMAASGSAFQKEYDQFWKDDFTVAKWALPYWGRMDMGGPATCNDLVWTAQGVFDYIKREADAIISNEDTHTAEFCQILNSASVGRCQTASRCNFLDGSLLSGWALREGGGEGCSGGFNITDALNKYSGGSLANAGTDLSPYIAIYDCLRN